MSTRNDGAPSRRRLYRLPRNAASPGSDVRHRRYTPWRKSRPVSPPSHGSPAKSRPPYAPHSAGSPSFTAGIASPRSQVPRAAARLAQATSSGAHAPTARSASWRSGCALGAWHSEKRHGNGHSKANGFSANRPPTATRQGHSTGRAHGASAQRNTKPMRQMSFAAAVKSSAKPAARRTPVARPGTRSGTRKDARHVTARAAAASRP